MLDVINEASIALLQISGRGIPVREGWYDPDITDTHISFGRLAMRRMTTATMTARARQLRFR